MPLRRILPLCCFALLCAAPAYAENVDGKLGVGFEETLTGTAQRQIGVLRDDTGQASAAPVPDVRPAGLALRYYLGNVGIEAIAGFGWHMPDTKAMESNGFVSLGLLYNVFRAPSVNLALGARVLTGWAKLDTASGNAEAMRVGVTAEIPLRVEYFFTPAFAIAGAVGPVLSFNRGRTNPLTGGTHSFDVALARGDFSGGIGFSYYFF